MALAPDVLAALSLNDVEYRYLGTLGGTGSLEDRREQIYGSSEHAYLPR